MTPITATDPQARSLDLTADNLTRLRALFPEAFTEGKVDMAVLGQLLGAAVDESDEKYGLNWHGKRRARQLALTPSAGTLRPAPADSVAWDTTQNLMIEGDNLEVLKLLQKSYAGQVKLIYIDPPYNTGKDFVYPDNFQDSIKNYQQLTGQVEGGQKISSNAETSGRFHTDWLNMIYPRLKLARNLLREDGVILISIDENEYANLHSVCGDIFGEENLVGTVVWINVTDNNPTQIATEHEYVLVISKNKASLEKEWKSAISDVKDILVRVGNKLTNKYKGDDLSAAYSQWFKENKNELWPLDRYKYIDEGGVFTGSQSVHNPGKEGYRYDVLHPKNGKPCKQPLMGYRFPKSTMDDLLAQGRIIFGDDDSKIIELKVYASEYQEKLSSLLELDGRIGAYDLKQDFPDSVKAFNNPKPVRFLNTFFPLIAKSDGDIILDFFAGSGTTGSAIYSLNSRDNVQRRFILVQLPEPLDPNDKEQKISAALCDALGKSRTIAELTKERLRRAAAKVAAAAPLFQGDLGFRVYRLDSTNIRAWDPNPADVAGSLFANAEHLKEGRSEADILTELLLKLGLPLTVDVEERQVGTHTLYAVGAGTLLACLSAGIERAEVETLAQALVGWQRELAPEGGSQVVLRDSAFRDDVGKANFTAILEQAGVDGRNIRSL